MRHAKSSWDDPSLNDYERPLSNRGKNNCNKIETFLSQKKIIPDISYVSILLQLFFPLLERGLS